MTIPLRPVIDCSATSDAAAAAILEREGPEGIVKHYAVPCYALGYGVMIVRQIPAIDWTRFDGWCNAFSDAGIGWSLYCNPRSLNVADVDVLVKAGLRCIVEGTGMGDDGWVLGAIKSVGLLDATEPAIDKSSPSFAKDAPCVVTDYEWQLGTEQPDGWHTFQIPPWDAAGGCWRWYQPRPDPNAQRPQVLAAVQAWQGSLEPNFVKCGVVPADLASTYGIRASEIAEVA